MKKIALLVLPAFVLGACSNADMKMVKEELAKGLKETKYAKGNRKSYRTKKRAGVPSTVAVVNSTSPACKGITLHKAIVFHEPVKYGGRLLTTIPMYEVTLSNSGKRRKVIFDILYTKHGGSKKYGSAWTRKAVKEDKPITLRSNSVNSRFNIGEANGSEVYEKISVVDCI